MDPSYKHLDKDTLNELLEVYRRNLGVLEVQAAKHGSAYVPVVIVNSIREAKKNIDEIEKELYKYEPNTVTEKQSPKILVIDDDATFREEIVSMLSDEDFVIVEASNGIEGLKLAEVEQPDITLLDIEMPEMDGYTVLAQIVEKRIRTRVLIISAYDNRVNVLIRAGACDYISKMDVNKAVLKTAIQRSLLLDYTVDVILDNPTRIINPLIERLEASYQREKLLKGELSSLIMRVRHRIKKLKDDNREESFNEILSMLETDIYRISPQHLEDNMNDFERRMQDVMKDFHILSHNLGHVKRFVERLSADLKNNYQPNYLEEMSRSIERLEERIKHTRMRLR